MSTRGIRLLGSILFFFLPGFFLLCFGMLPLFADEVPAVRVVRLSLAQGDVQVDRSVAPNVDRNSGGQGWEQAINNMPLTSGARLYAAENSRAAIEFEDGSSVRMMGPAQIALTQLSFAPGGSPGNTIEIDSGLVYVHAAAGGHASFRVQDSSGGAFAIPSPAEVRLDAGEQVVSVAVLSGTVQVLGGAESSAVHAGESYNYILGQPDSAVRLSKVLPEEGDGWNQQRDQYQDEYANSGAEYSGAENPDTYGAADLGFYGSYEDVAGYGEAWQPNDVGPDWDPFDYGAWCYGPDWGWTFVSGYPWGWLPFYYGDWFYVSGRGWWWHPGPHRHDGGFHARPVLASAGPHGFSAPHPPGGSAHRTVAIAGSHLNVGPIGVTHAASMERPGIERSGSGRASIAPAAIGRTGQPEAFSSYSTCGPSGGRPGASVPVRSATAEGPVISGHRGAYVVNGAATPGSANPGSANRGGSYETARPPTYEPAPARRSYAETAPRAYSYGGYGQSSPAPHAMSAPSMPAPHYSPEPGFTPHVSSGFSGGGFHGGGGFSGGGGFHGGGGGGRR